MCIIGKYYKGFFSFDYFDRDDLSLFKLRYILQNASIVASNLTKAEKEEIDKNSGK